MTNYSPATTDGEPSLLEVWLELDLTVQINGEARARLRPTSSGDISVTNYVSPIKDARSNRTLIVS